MGTRLTLDFKVRRVGLEFLGMLNYRYLDIVNMQRFMYLR